MVDEKRAKIQSLNQPETEVLQVLLRDQNFKVKDLAASLYRSEQAIRGNLTAIFKKLGVPETVENKREWVVREYLEVYNTPSESVESQPEIYIAPPEPIVVNQQPANRPLLEGIQLPTRAQRILPLAAALLAVALGLLLGLGIGEIRVRDLASKYIPQAPFLLNEQFSEPLADGVVVSGDTYIENGNLHTNSGAVLAYGNKNWKNYIVNARVRIPRCGDNPGRNDYVSLIGVRNNEVRGYYTAYEWPACNFNNDDFIDIAITVRADRVITKANDGQLYDFTVPSGSSGGIIFEIDKSTEIDFILVTRLPQEVPND